MQRLFLNISLGPYAGYAQAGPEQLPQMPHLGHPVPQSGPPEPQFRHTEPQSGSHMAPPMHEIRPPVPQLGPQGF